MAIQLMMTYVFQCIPRILKKQVEFPGLLWPLDFVKEEAIEMKFIQSNE